MEARSFDGLKEAIRHLEAEHRPGLAYRGQTKRYPRIARVIGGRQEEVEALYPEDFRFRASDPPLTTDSTSISRRREHGRDVRDRFEAALFEHVVRRLTSDDEDVQWAAMMVDEKLRLQEHMLESGALTWEELSRRARDVADSQSDEPPPITYWRFLRNWSPRTLAFNRLSWALAQHYGVSTALLDVTSSLPVAAWFATQPWNPGSPPPQEGLGVIYRFDLGLLLRAATAWHRVMIRWAYEEKRLPPPEPFVQSLRLVPSSFAARPTRQHGLSIYGTDNDYVLSRAEQMGAIGAFLFPHTQDAPVVVGRREITPPDDPFLDFLALHNSQERP